MKDKIDALLKKMAELIDVNRQKLLDQNSFDLGLYMGNDTSIYDRLIINDDKIDGMIKSLHDVIEHDYPVGKTLLSFNHENGLKISNKTVPFGTILIIYESRPDVTIEATAIALKSGNKILLKGGKEARQSNLFLHQLWLKALQFAEMGSDVVRYLDLNRQQLQDFMKAPDTNIDLIIPRGGEKLIDYVKSIAKCPVLVSGRGNNFAYVSDKADLTMANSIIVHSKLSKISACNALDKVLINNEISDDFMEQLQKDLKELEVEIITQPSDEVWEEEFLAKKIVLWKVKDLDEGINMINKYSGKHSATIITSESEEAGIFMDQVDCAAVYHNASTRFTDGGQLGLGAEMAISTEKLHHRGPLGLDQLVTNKWFIFGEGQVR